MADIEDWPEELRNIWSELESPEWSNEEREHWVSDAADLFESGFIDIEGKDAQELQDIRDAFFEMMEQYDISIEDFDWDDWRDWYAAS
jgi:hypothetical protein